MYMECIARGIRKIIRLEPGIHIAVQNPPNALLATKIQSNTGRKFEMEATQV